MNTKRGAIRVALAASYINAFSLNRERTRSTELKYCYSYEFNIYTK